MFIFQELKSVICISCNKDFHILNNEKISLQSFPTSSLSLCGFIIPVCIFTQLFSLCCNKYRHTDRQTHTRVFISLKWYYIIACIPLCFLVSDFYWHRFCFYTI